MHIELRSILIVADLSSSTPESPSDEVAEVTTKLESYRELVMGAHDPKLGIGDADGVAYAIGLVGAPTLAFAYDWTSMWGALGLSLAVPAAIGIGHGVLESCGAWFKTSRVGVRLAHLVPMLAAGATLGMVYRPMWAGVALGLSMGVCFLMSERAVHRTRNQRLAQLELAPDLVHELVTVMPTQLHQWVLDQIEGVIEGREQLQKTLNETLHDDDFIDQDKILYDVDMALAELLDRAVPLSALLGRNDSRAQTAVTEAKTVFNELSRLIDDMYVTYMSYATGRDHSKLDALKARMADLKYTQKAQDELESYLQ